MIVIKILRRGFNVLASVALAVPLLVLIAVATIIGTFIPQGRNVPLAPTVPEWARDLNAYLQLNDIFHSGWYLLLLVLLGISLLAITIKRVPVVWQQRGRGIAIGILLAHAGVLIFLGGAVTTGTSGFRYYTRLIEGDVKVLPELPFVIRLDRIDLEYDSGEISAGAGTRPRVARRQDSTLSFFKHGSEFQQATTGPGQPAEVRGVTLLPDPRDIGWAFDLVVRDQLARERVIPVRPWAPQIIRLGVNAQYIISHRVFSRDTAGADTGKAIKPDTTEVYLIEEGGKPRSLGFATEAAPLSFNGYTIMPWNIRPYTGMHIYRRQGMPLVIAGITCLMAGLLITFYLGRRTFASAATKTETSGTRAVTSHE